MAKSAMEPHQFEQLLLAIQQETYSSELKKNILFRSRGFFTAHQASSLLHAFENSSDKVQVMQILEQRLCPMTCSEAKDIVGSFSIHNDKVTALQTIKRVLQDSHTGYGVESMLSAFPYEYDKQRAFSSLRTVKSSVHDRVAAGGHQGYAALGGLYTQSRPLVPHLYGSIGQQGIGGTGQEDIPIPVQARPRTVPSMYVAQPSHAYPQGRDYVTDRQYPGHVVPNFYSDYPVTNLERDYGNPTGMGSQSHTFTGLY